MYLMKAKKKNKTQSYLAFEAEKKNSRIIAFLGATTYVKLQLQADIALFFKTFLQLKAWSVL